jgi:hypothetical protein
MEVEQKEPDIAEIAMFIGQKLWCISNFLQLPKGFGRGRSRSCDVHHVLTTLAFLTTAHPAVAG